jgi:hypothetical protein
MSIFANPPRYSAETARAYVAALLDALGDRDPIETMARTPAALRDAVAGLSDEALRTPERPGKWSVVEVVQHLADTEVVYGYWMRVTVAQDRPSIPGYDQDAWAKNLRYDAVRVEDALADQEALRTMNLRWLRSLTDEEMERVGIHAERGEESIHQITRLLAAHDLVHLRQIERIKGAVGG